MQPELMREIVTIEAFDRWLQVLAVSGLLAGIGAGLVWARRLKHPRRFLLGLLTGLVGGLMPSLLYGLWRFYLWRIRIDLDRNFVGLHRVDVLLGNLVLFAMVGALIGIGVRFFLRWLARQCAVGE